MIRPPFEKGNAFRVALVLLVTASVLGAALVFAYFTSPAIAGVEVSAVAVAVLGGVAALGLWLSYTGRVSTGGLVLVLGLSLLFPFTSALIADLGILLGIALAVNAAAIATLTLAGRTARAAIVIGVLAAIITLLLDLFFDSIAAWPRLRLPAFTQGVALPIATALVALALAVLVGTQFRRYTLSTQMLVGFLLLALLPIALVSYLNDQQARADLRQATNRSLLATAQQTAAGLDGFIQSNLNAVQTQGRLPSMYALLALPREQRPGSALEAQVLYVFGIMQSSPQLSVSAEQRPAVKAHYLLDDVGNIVLSTTGKIEDPDFFRGEVFLAPLATDQAYISPVCFSATMGPTLFFSAPVVDKSARRVGVLVAQVDAGWLGEVVTQGDPPEGEASLTQTEVAVFDEHTLELAHSRPDSEDVWRFAALPDAATRQTLEAAGRVPPRSDAELDAQLPDLAATLRASSAGTPAFFTGVVNSASAATGKQTHLAAIVSLRTRPWRVIASQPESVALQPAREQTRNTVLIALAIALPVAALAALATRALTRPITDLTAAAQRVAGGDLAARVAPAANDELDTLARTFNTMTAQLQESVHTLEERVAERTAQLQATADISRATAGVRNLGELLELAVEMIRARFGFYHASVFLIDEAGEYAVLRESTGEIGAQLKAVGHRLAIGSRSLVGWVTQNRRLRIARDVADDPFHFKNPLLPETHSELCLPLLVGDRLLGVLDVQSRELNAFGESDVQALQVLGDQLSVAIENAGSFQRTQAALAESRSRYQQQLTDQWQDVLGAGPRETVYELEPGLALGVKANGADDDGLPLQIPLRLRERTIGVIELHGRSGGPLTEAEQAMLSTIAAQLSTALESAVLVQESQLRGQRERLITQITDEIRSTLNPAFILQGGIRQLGRAVGATEVVVKLQPGERPAPGGARGGSR